MSLPFQQSYDREAIFPTNLHLFINNEWVESMSGKTFPVINPVDGSELCRVSEAAVCDVNKAVEAAERALEGEWKSMGARGRQDLLLKLGELWQTKIEELSALESLNNGTAISLQRSVIESLINEIRYHAGFCDKVDGRVVCDDAIDGNYHVYTKREPIGVCGMIIAWNLPLWCLMVKLMPCLAMGNTVVVKPAEQTPLTALKVGEMLKEVGFPPGVVNILPGYGPTTGASIASHMKVRKIAFTGSTEVGRLIMKASGDSNLKQVQLELGGKSPLVIFDDVDLDEAVEIAASVFWNNGQECDACSRTFVHEGIYDQFVEKAVERAKKLKIGDPLDPETDIGPVVSPEQYERVLDYINCGKTEGARLAYGGSDLSKEQFGGKGYYVQPTIFADVTDDMKICREEIFGPVQCLIKFSSVQEVVHRCNDTSYGLAGGVLSKNIGNIFAIANNLKAGTVWVNDYSKVMPQAEFGGMKQSGFGREGGVTALSEWTNTKTVCMKIPNVL